MLVNAKDMLDSAEAGHYAVGAFNTNDLEWCRSILQAAEDTNSPVIVQCSMSAAKYQTGYKTVSELVHAVYDAMNLTVPVALHLDHGTYEACLECIDAGFTSVMYDGSHEENFETNLAKTKELVKICHDKGISIEAEVGSIGGTEDGVTGTGECADPDECATIAETGVDFLAAGIGNIHGLYPANWEGLRFDVLEAIRQRRATCPSFSTAARAFPTTRFKKLSTLVSPRLT